MKRPNGELVTPYYFAYEGTVVWYTTEMVTMSVIFTDFDAYSQIWSTIGTSYLWRRWRAPVKTRKYDWWYHVIWSWWIILAYMYSLSTTSFMIWWLHITSNITLQQESKKSPKTTAATKTPPFVIVTDFAEVMCLAQGEFVCLVTYNINWCWQHRLLAVSLSLLLVILNQCTYQSTHSSIHVGITQSSIASSSSSSDSPRPTSDQIKQILQHTGIVPPRREIGDARLDR